LDDASKEGIAGTATIDKLYLARVTRVLGGSQMELLTQDNTEERARIPGTLRAKGSVSHKRQKAHVFGVGDVVIVDHGDIRAKIDSPALLALMEDRFKTIGYTVPPRFFSATKDTSSFEAELKEAEEETGWEFDRSAEAAKLRKKRSLRPSGGAGKEEDEEVEIDIDSM
jgi:hypothetical protein